MMIQRVRVRFAKQGRLRSISHLDLMRAFERALRRTGLPLRVSEGFHPRPRLSFPAPLGLGAEGLDEVMEFDLEGWTPAPDIRRRLAEQLPEGLGLLDLALVSPHEHARVKTATYRVRPAEALRDDPRWSREALRAVMDRTDLPAQRVRKGQNKTVNVRPFVEALERTDDEIVLTVQAGPEGSTRPEEVLQALGFPAEDCRSRFDIRRSRVTLANESLVQ